MAKKGKIEVIKSDGTWDSKYGLMYKFKVTIGGDTGELLAKSDKLKYEIGEEVEYEFTPGDFPKIKIIPAQKPFGGNKPNPAAFAMSYAKDLVVADKIVLGDISKYADLIYNWIKSKE